MSKKPNRRKLRKKERTLLWYAAEGKCRICGEDLDPDNWHADHIVPFSISKQTNIHEMQALCPKCNREKGTRMLRKHQLEMLEICKQILAGRKVKTIICHVTPGGGKSALPVILAEKLIPAKAEKIAWFVPRTSLRKQGEEAFTNEFLRRPLVFGHNCLIRQSTNDNDPSRRLHGFITTYQAIIQDPWRLSQEFDRHKYILFLDEPHHIAVGSRLESSLKPLIERAELVILASGTLERGDKKQIAFLPYKRKGFDLVVDLEQTEETRIIQYSRRDALSEKAISYLEFDTSDSKAEWVDKEGEIQNSNSFHDEDADIRSALRTSLETSFATQLLDKAINHWRGHKSLVYQDALMLVVSPNIFVAKMYLDHLRSTGLKAQIVTSDEDSKTNERIIKRFKSGGLDALVTVAIAYEGLDVPEITHVVCLTHYRSKPWLEQCFGRAVRGGTWGFIFTPDDPYMNKIIEDLKKDYITPAREETDGSGGSGPGDYNDIIPQGSELTTSRAITPNLGDTVSAEQYRLIERARENSGLPPGLSITQLNRFLLESGILPLENSQKEPHLNVPLVTPTEQEDNLKATIYTYTKKVDRIYHGMDWGKTNKEILRVFHKHREDMAPEELQNVWRYLQRNYPLEDVRYGDPYS